MHLLNINGVEKYLVMCEHPDPQTWADYILCFNVKDIDLVAYSDFKFDAKMIKKKGLIEFGENRVEADAIVPVDITKHTMSYPRYEMYKCHKADCVRIDAEEGRNYKFSLWNYFIGMGETCFRAKNGEYNIDLYFIGVEYINMPLGRDKTGVLVKTEDKDVAYISKRMGKEVPKDKIHVFCFEDSRRYIVGTRAGFYKNTFVDCVLYDGR